MHVCFCCRLIIPVNNKSKNTETNMAANKFATMLHRNTHKITAILVYALLEWTLIILLLLNSLFSYLISKFASYFGLKPPCLWCSRVDHVLEPNQDTHASYRDLVCETHATEISRLAYCSTHQRLAQLDNMCEDCLASQPHHTHRPSVGFAPRIGFFSWISQDSVENGDSISRCSCCNETLRSSTETYPPCLLLKPFSWDGLSCKKKGTMMIMEAMDGESNEEPRKAATTCKEVDHERIVAVEHDQILSDVESFSFREGAEDCSRSSQSDDKEANEDEKASALEISKFSHQSSGSTLQCSFREDHSFEIIHMYSDQNYISCDSNRLFPVELIDSSTNASQRSCTSEKEDLGDHECQNEAFDAEPEIEEENDVSREAAQVLSVGGSDAIAKHTEEPSDPPATQEIDDLNIKSVYFASDEVNDLEETKLQPEEPAPSLPSSQPQEEPSSMNGTENCAEQFDSHEAFIDANTFSQKHICETGMPEITTLSEKSQEGTYSNEVEEEKFPETPTSVEGLHYLQKKSPVFSGNEESLDGSVISEMECGDPSFSIEQMKTALKAERKTLSAIYAELEEERSASAIAANQTMAMITRLQEEKAAMRMEALQYQRMMEEQSEYDQEALQLLNELMNKREKEKQELENELEIYRKKVLEYEAREKLMMAKTRNRSIRSSSSSSNGEEVRECDEHSIDLNREARDDGDSFFDHIGSIHNNSPTASAVINLEEMSLDCVKHIGNLDVSLTEIEEERQFILEQLKTLEDKLLTVGDEQFFEDLKSIENLANIQEFEETSPEENGKPIEPSEDLEEKSYHERKSMGSMAKSLLPLLDAADNEILDGSMSEEQVQSEALKMLNSLDSKFEMEGKKVAIEEEVDQVYERIQALETDEEFLQHCMSSIKKGDKGVDLLQEILQHLRDLRTVDLHLRNMNDDQQGEVAHDYHE